MNNLELIGISELAQLLDLNRIELKELRKSVSQSYQSYKIKKKQGGFRRIEAPDIQLKAIQHHLLHNLLNEIPTHPSIFGGPGTSIIDALKEHVRKPVVITMDIENFFPSIKKHSVQSALLKEGFQPETAKIITDITSYHGHLPQGAPTSPALARIVLSPAAERIDCFIRRISHICRCSIYVDDIIISGAPGLKRALNTIQRILRDYKLFIRPDKTRIMRRDADQFSLNARLNDRIDATTEYLKEIEALSSRVGQNDPHLRGKKAFVKFLRSGNYPSIKKQHP